MLNKFASKYLEKISEHPSKYKNREDYIQNGKLGSSLNAVRAEQLRAKEWDEWYSEQEATRLAEEFGIDTSNGMSVKKKFGKIVSINGVDVSQSNKTKQSTPPTPVPVNNVGADTYLEPVNTSVNTNSRRQYHEQLIKEVNEHYLPHSVQSVH